MLHAAHEPPAPLARLVQSLWIQEEPAVDEPVEPTVLLPVGYAALVFEYGDPFEELGADGVARRLAPVVLAGPCTRPVRVRALGRTGLVIVPFRPWGAAAFFPGAAGASERFVELEALVSPAEVRRVHAQVLEAADERGRRAAVERFLLARLGRVASDACVVAAVERIERAEGREPIADVARHLGIGRRHLARRFAETLGLGPKAFARIVRFQGALRRARAGEPWATVAARAGYSDQAHLVKECQALSGCTPVELIGEVEQRAVGRYFNAGDPALRPATLYL